jgi:hypothetical protein
VTFFRPDPHFLDLPPLQSGPHPRINTASQSERAASAMLTWEDVAARKRRLVKLALGLQREIGIVGEHDDPLHFVERRAYLKALCDAIAGIETARVGLAQAEHRNARAERRRGEGRVSRRGTAGSFLHNLLR